MTCGRSNRLGVTLTFGPSVVVVLFDEQDYAALGRRFPPLSAQLCVARTRDVGLGRR